MPLIFQNSQKGKPQIVLNGHLFSFHIALSTGNRSWKCVHCSKSGCTARLHTSPNDLTIVQELSYHNHPGDSAKVKAKAVVNQLRQRARDTEEAPQQMVANVTAGINQAIAVQMPSVASMKRTAQRVRQRENVAVALPLNLIVMQVPDQYSRTVDGAPFLLFDSGPGNDRILIFSTATNMQMLSRSRHWYADGTFKTVPLLFEQLYTIHGMQDDNVMPAIYAILPNKQRATYVRLFTEIKNLQQGLNPESIMTDFELASINAFMAEFPQARQRGCFFHFNQCIWRKMQDLGLTHRHDIEEGFALQAKMLPALAFVPPDDVVEAFEILTGGGHLPAELEPLVDYFEDLWIGRRRGNGRRVPRFPIRLWNCYGSVINGLAKTNNACEGWHNGFRRLVGGEHPPIWTFIKSGLQKDQSLNQFKVEQYIAGQPPPLGRRTYRDCAERIAVIVGRYNNEWLNNGQNDGLIDYLRGLAHNYNFHI